jgi:type IV secretion system protein VirD4
LLSNSENTLSSVVATFNAPLTIFSDAVVDAATSADDFRLGRRAPSAHVGLCAHPAEPAGQCPPLLNLFFSQLVSLNTQRCPSRTRR